MAIGKTPNLYQLSGDGVHVTYATDGIRGDPSLGYKDRAQSRSFIGESQIKTETTSAGTLVTVMLNVVPDEATTTFSLLVPSIALAETGGSLPVSTLGITTVHRSSFVGPPIGQDEVYETAHLHGSAHAVVF